MLNSRGQIWGLAKIYCLGGNAVVFKQYTVLNLGTSVLGLGKVSPG